MSFCRLSMRDRANTFAPLALNDVLALNRAIVALLAQRTLSRGQHIRAARAERRALTRVRGAQRGRGRPLISAQLACRGAQCDVHGDTLGAASESESGQCRSASAARATMRTHSHCLRETTSTEPRCDCAAGRGAQSSAQLACRGAQCDVHGTRSVLRLSLNWANVVLQTQRARPCTFAPLARGH